MKFLDSEDLRILKELLEREIEEQENFEESEHVEELQDLKRSLEKEINLIEEI